ncbi:MAG: hypothetical protein DBP01_16060 [gamma proteobacterium symbiont of Ctena orbiculata]|nr:MAG: hypothetical protein DBP01_16060 [gamma proteobacterium symbiont of Ctena orbiculata]
MGDAITETVQLWLAASVVGQSLDWVKSPLLETARSRSDELPVFLIVTVSALLVVFTGVSGKAMLSEDVPSTPLWAFAVREID